MSEEMNTSLELRVEATLFAFGDWLTVDEIKSATKAKSEKEIIQALEALHSKYTEEYAFRVTTDGSGQWKMVLRDEFEPVVQDLVAGIEIPTNVLKVLSVIAYEQPISKTRLSEILGRTVKQEVDFLYKAKFVDYKKQGIGRFYSVTKKFFDYFKVDDEEDFKERANKQLSTFLQEPTELQEGASEMPVENKG